MPYQEINLPLPLMLFLLVAMIILLIIVAKKEATITFELPPEPKQDNTALTERYGAYIQSQGKYWN
ncbi:MAG: hypothetical protein K6F12_05175 [Streptococcus sp.]|uniref:hypothetical protein n=1 Tax=Streptococcus sp. TaxID=1306 RepID=UPI00258828E4|nr:hypothetical protein [Streptococcus sp.]MCR5493040.1 hypothetical protein [Streptococcus sp.]